MATTTQPEVRCPGCDLEVSAYIARGRFACPKCNAGIARAPGADRVRALRCPHCDHDTTGQALGGVDVCPECGGSIFALAARATARRLALRWALFTIATLCLIAFCAGFALRLVHPLFGDMDPWWLPGYQAMSLICFALFLINTPMAATIVGVRLHRARASGALIAGAVLFTAPVAFVTVLFSGLTGWTVAFHVVTP
jgi:Zn finger protein HypA/HybF involved in hydrogenase expression